MLRQSTPQTFAGGQREPWYSGVAARVPAKALVSCGIVMFALYIAMDVIASLRYDGYSYKDQAISELSAIGAPTRGMWLAFSAVYALLTFAFAVGVLRVAGQRRKVRTVGWIFLAGAIGGLLWWIAPMHQREVLAAGGDTWQDTMHLVTGALSSLAFFAAIGVGMFAFGRWFRWYSVLTVAAMLVFGMLMNLDMPEVADDKPTPWLGIWERIAIEGAMLWQAVFAGVLLWRLRDDAQSHASVTASANADGR